MTWRVHEFAKMSGVTVKALYHYDRIGLLKPARSESGYRIYSERDLERLEQIAALRFLGMPLKRIAGVVDGLPTDFRESLRLQRQALEEKRKQVDGAIEAIDAAERAEGRRAVEHLILAVQGLQVDISKYFSPEGQATLRAFHESLKTADWTPEWKELQKDMVAAAGEDPEGETGRALTRRFQDFAERNRGAFPTFTPLPNPPKLPPALMRRFEKLDFVKTMPFLRRAWEDRTDK